MARTPRSLFLFTCWPDLRRLLRLGAAATVTGLLLGACFGGGESQQVDLEALLLKLEDLPVGWEVWEGPMYLKPPQGALDSVVVSYRRSDGEEGRLSVTAVLADNGREEEVLDRVLRAWLAPGLAAHTTDDPIQGSKLIEGETRPTADPMPGSTPLEGEKVHGLVFREDSVTATVIAFDADDVDVEELAILMRERILRELSPLDD